MASAFDRPSGPSSGTGELLVELDPDADADLSELDRGWRGLDGPGRGEDDIVPSLDPLIAFRGVNLGTQVTENDQLVSASFRSVFNTTYQIYPA